MRKKTQENNVWVNKIQTILAKLAENKFEFEGVWYSISGGYDPKVLKAISDFGGITNSFPLRNEWDSPLGQYVRTLFRDSPWLRNAHLYELNEEQLDAQAQQLFFQHPELVISTHASYYPGSKKPTHLTIEIEEKSPHIIPDNKI